MGGNVFFGDAVILVLFQSTRADILVTHDVNLAGIGPGLNLDQHHWHPARVLHPADGTKRNIDAFGFGHGFFRCRIFHTGNLYYGNFLMVTGRAR